MDTRVRTKKGEVQGVRADGAVIFRNIPYAKPPVGALRWRRPEEMDPWEGVLDCSAFGKITVQDLPGDEKPWDRLYYKEFYSNPDYMREMGEDCLNLNIYVPDRAQSPGGKLPVAFWIHGGGFGGGYSSEIEFDGVELARRGVILVTVEYRCGALGFLAHPWLSAEDPDGISGNYGLYDQIAALRFVRENISAFGGDPDNITVFGQSAGCMSVQVLISSPLTEGMISKAILQSGVQAEGHFLATPTLAEEEAYGERIAELAGAASLEALRALPADRIKEAKAKFDGEKFLETQTGDGAGSLVVVPCVDGVLLRETVGEALAKGRTSAIPCMAGCVLDDLGTTDADREAGVPGMLLEEVKRFLTREEELGAPPSYAYLFARELPDEDGKYVAAFHSAELWYHFGTLGRCWRPFEAHDYALSRSMLDAWTNFMKTGDPNGGAMEGWRPFTKADACVQTFR